MFKLLQSLK